MFLNRPLNKIITIETNLISDRFIRYIIVPNETKINYKIFVLSNRTPYIKFLNMLTLNSYFFTEKFIIKFIISF